jgi:hypothetical protein
VGVPLGNGAGEAYVFSRSGTTWSLASTPLTASDAANLEEFGWSVAISGNTVIVGAPAPYAEARGEAYVFASAGSAWTQRAILTASDSAANNNFGYSVAISGTTALVGADEAALGTSVGVGAAYIFASSSGSWQQQQEFRPPGAVADSRFGTSVALSGTTAVVGASGSAQGAGGAFVFVVGGSGSGTPLSAGDAVAGDALGSSVAISGSTIVAGAPQKANLTGAAYVFSTSGSSWVQQQEIVPGDAAAGDNFGTAVAISGSVIGFGAYTKGNGVAYLYGPQAVNAPALGRMTPVLAALLVLAAWRLRPRQPALGADPKGEDG